MPRCGPLRAPSPGERASPCITRFRDERVERFARHRAAILMQRRPRHCISRIQPGPSPPVVGVDQGTPQMHTAARCPCGTSVPHSPPAAVAGYRSGSCTARFPQAPPHPAASSCPQQTALWTTPAADGSCDLYQSLPSVRCRGFVETAISPRPEPVLLPWRFPARPPGCRPSLARREAP